MSDPPAQEKRLGCIEETRDRVGRKRFLQIASLGGIAAMLYPASCSDSQTASPTEDWLDLKADFGATGDGHTDDSGPLQEAVSAAGSQGNALFCPAGTYKITEGAASQSDGCQIFGAGKTLTVFQLGADIEALMTFQAPDYPSFDSVVSFGGLSDLTIFNPSRTYAGDGVRFYGAERHWLRSVHFQAINGCAIAGKNWWDSYVENVNVELCGSAADAKHSIDMQKSDASTDNSGCNNNSFVALKVEGSDYVGMVLGPGARRNRLWGGKFHGVFPTPKPYPHMVLDGAYTNYLSDMNITQGGDAGVVVKNGAKGNSIKGGQINAQAAYGIDMDATTWENLVADVIFGFAGQNASGDARDQSGKNVFSFGSVFADSTTVGKVSGFIGDYRGNGTPEGRQVAAPGSTYRRLDPVAGGAFYVKQSGANDSSGWVAL
jgi:hypothetical protein